MELVALIKVLSFPFHNVQNLTRTARKSFGQAVNIDAQLAVILRYANHSDVALHDFCITWKAVVLQKLGAVRWKTTNSIQRWRKVHKLQPQLLCATVVDPVPTEDLAVLNVTVAVFANPGTGGRVVGNGPATD